MKYESLKRLAYAALAAGSVAAMPSAVFADGYGVAFYHATVGADATFRASSGVHGVTRLNSGVADVAFNRDITSCSFVTSLVSGSPAGYANAFYKTNSTTDIVVRTYTQSGTLTNLAFGLIVACGP